jgi:putative ABC transport system ATP-binding protein
MSSILIVENLEKKYKLGNIEVNALRGIDLEIRAGEFVAILGPSGSGKSTLLNLFSALDRPSAGTIRFEDVDLANLNDNQLSILRRKIGIVFQFFNLIGRFNARENVELPMMIMNLSKRERIERALKLLEVVGLGDRVNHKPSELSGGERQRVAIARALANEPSLLLLDEPTGNIDSKTAMDLMELVHKLNKERGVTIVMVTHDRSLIKYTDRTIRLLDGEISEGGETTE